MHYIDIVIEVNLRYIFFGLVKPFQDTVSEILTLHKSHDLITLIESY